MNLGSLIQQYSAGKFDFLALRASTSLLYAQAKNLSTIAHLTFTSKKLIMQNLFGSYRANLILHPQLGTVKKTLIEVRKQTHLNARLAALINFYLLEWTFKSAAQKLSPIFKWMARTGKYIILTPFAPTLCIAGSFMAYK